MINTLPNLIILNILNFLKLPDILNLLNYKIIKYEKIKNFKKKLVYRDIKNETNYIFHFSLSYLLLNYLSIISELNYIRNNFFIDYTFCSNTYMSYISYIESREWFIIEYYLEWFQSKNFFELPNYCENNLFMESFENHKYLNNDKIVKNNDMNLVKKIKKFVTSDKNYKNIKLFDSNFSVLKNIHF